MNPHAIPPLSDFKYKTDLQIRFNDVDVLGHVNNTVYMALYDTGKAYFFSSIHEQIIEWKKVETVIANVDCCFISPIFFGEEIEVYTRCESIAEKSFKLLQVIALKGTREIKSACETVMVAFDPMSHTSMLVPDHWRKALEKSMAK